MSSLSFHQHLLICLLWLLRISLVLLNMSGCRLCQTKALKWSHSPFLRRLIQVLSSIPVSKISLYTLRLSQLQPGAPRRRQFPNTSDCFHQNQCKSQLMAQNPLFLQVRIKIAHIPGAQDSAHMPMTHYCVHSPPSQDQAAVVRV